MVLAQWIPNSKPNSKSVKSHLLLVVDKPRTHYRISTLRLGWLVPVVLGRRRVRVARGWLQKREELQDNHTGYFDEMTRGLCEIYLELDRRSGQVQLTFDNAKQKTVP